MAKNNKKVMNKRTHNTFETYKKGDDDKISDTFDHKDKTKNMK